MNDQLISQLTGIPLRQIQSYNPQQKQQVIAMAKKNPKWDTFQDNINKDSMEQSSKSMEKLGYTPGLQGWTKSYTSNYQFEKPKPKLVRQPRQLTDQEIQEEVELTKKLNPTYQYEHFASVKDPNRIGVIVTNPITGEKAEYAKSYVDMYGNDIENPSWVYVGKGISGAEGQSWRKVAGNMRVDGRQVDSSNKPIHSSASSYPEAKQAKQTPKVETRQKQPSEVPTSVVATINRTAARFPGGGGYSANGKKNGKAFFGLADSDALINLAGDAWNATKGFMSKLGDYLAGPEKPIQTNTPSYGRRNLITEGMQKVHNTFGNAYH